MNADNFTPPFHGNPLYIDAGAKAAFEALAATGFAGKVAEALGLSVSHDRTQFKVDCRDGADEAYEDGGTRISVYRLPTVTLFFEEGDRASLKVSPPETDIIDYFRRWDWGDCDSFEEFLASFGIEVDVEEAGADATKVRIWHQPHFISGTHGAELAGYVTDDDGDKLEFDSFADAEEWIAEAEDEIYYLRSGEFARPTYTIVAWP